MAKPNPDPGPNPNPGGGNGIVFPTLETPGKVKDTSSPRLEADVDDPAIYLNKNDASKSIVVTTMKKGGLAVYDLQGKEIQTINPNNIRYNNVDLVYDFQLGNKKVDLAVVSDRRNDTLAIFQIDPNSGKLSNITAPALSNSAASIFGVNDGRKTAYGLTTYNSVVDGKSYVFASQLNGSKIAQLELVDNGSGGVDAKVVRTLNVPGSPPTVEGMVVDRERGILYAAQEDFGIFKFDAEVNGSNQSTVVDTVANPATPLKDDIEGLTMYYGRDAKGYLLASSQGNDSYAVYDREGNNSYLGNFVIGDGNGIDGTQSTDGIQILGNSLGSQFPDGLLVAQDGSNENRTTNLKFVDLRDLENSANFFKLDTNQFDPRNPKKIDNGSNPDPNPNPNPNPNPDPNPDPNPNPDIVKVTFEQGLNGYAGTVDTFIEEAFPNTDYSNATSLNVDTRDRGGAVQSLLRFDDIFGSQAGQISKDSDIVSARLELDVSNRGNSLKFNRMLTNWSDTDTWGSLGNGIQANNVEAASTSDAVTGSVPTGPLSVDVTASLKAWQTNPDSNLGWAILPTGSNGVDLGSAESTTKPRLVVEYKNTSSPDPDPNPNPNPNPDQNSNPDPNPNPEPQKTNLVWENQNLVNDASVKSGSTFNLGSDLTATVDWDVKTNGGTFVPDGGNDFVSYKSDTTGAHEGYLKLGFDNSSSDPNDGIGLSIRFNKPVTGLNFDVLNVDSGATFDDAVEIFADGVNIRDIPNAFTLGGSSVQLDDESYLNGFEGKSNAPSSDPSANIQVNLGSTEVSEVKLFYTSTDDLNLNPDGQDIGISDLSWSA